jgi:hypothetical protein
MRKRSEWAHDHDVLFGGVGAKMFRDEHWCRLQIIVDEQDQLTLGGMDAGISRPGRAAVGLADWAQNEGSALLRQPFGSTVRRSVVDHDDFEIVGARGLALETI